MPIYDFPNPLTIDPDGDGLICFGGDLEADTLLQAYRQGLFPWFNEDEPIAWWSPEPRCVIQPEDFRPSKSLIRNMKKFDYQIRIDSDFQQVIQSCAAPRDYTNQTWISPAMQASYLKLHQLGYAHSIEVWDHDELIGGLYGLNIGRGFFGESMFSRRTDVSKMAFYMLMRLCQQEHCPFVDCQLVNDHLLSLGAIAIPRHQFLNQLQQIVNQPHIIWQFYQNKIFLTREIAQSHVL